MTANFPSSTYSPRTKINRTGIIYDPTKTTVGYAEDITKLDAEVVAMENYLRDPSSAPAGSIQSIVGELMTGDCDGLNYFLTSAHIPIAGTYAVYSGGVRLRENDGYVVSGNSFTFSSAPGDESYRPEIDYKYLKT